MVTESPFRRGTVARAALNALWRLPPPSYRLDLTIGPANGQAIAFKDGVLHISEEVALADLPGLIRGQWRQVLAYKHLSGKHNQKRYAGSGQALIIAQKITLGKEIEGESPREVALSPELLDRLKGQKQFGLPDLLEGLKRFGEKHLPGKHDQRTHGRGGGAGLAPALESALTEWVNFGDAAGLKGEVVKALAGRSSSPEGAQIAEALKRAPVKADVLHRGMRLSESEIPQQGKQFDIPMASASKKREVALEFAQGQYRETGSHPVMLEIIGPRRQFDIPSHLMPRGYEDAESLVSGSFVIRDRRPLKMGNEDGYFLTLRSLE